MQLRSCAQIGVIALVLSACAAPGVPAGAPVAAVVVSAPSTRIVIGEDDSLTARLTDSGGATLSGRSISWSVADPGVATVSASGVVTAVAAGSTTVYATSEGRSGSTTITVLPLPTLLVLNSTCQGMQCDTLSILGFPENQPRTPGGLWRVTLGMSTAPSLCITLPPTAHFNVYGPSSTTTYTWTAGIAMALGTQPPSAANALDASPSTDSFAPTDASGWSVTLPGNGTPVAAVRCTP